MFVNLINLTSAHTAFRLDYLTYCRTIDPVIVNTDEALTSLMTMYMSD